MASQFVNLQTIDRPFLLKERNIILVPDDMKFHALIPKTAKVTLLDNRAFYIIKNTPAANARFNHNGHPILSPMYFDRTYDWSKIKPFSAQIEMAAVWISWKKLYNLSDLGVGKTYGTLYAIDWMIKNGYAKRALVVAPLSILDVVWKQSIRNKFPRLRPAVIHGPVGKRQKLLKLNEWNIAIINHDGIKTVSDELLNLNFDIVVVDELGGFRDTRTERWKVAKKIVDKIEYAIGLSGTPTPAGPWDAYALRKLINPAGFRMTYLQFKQSVAVEVRQGIWKPRKEAKDIVYATLQPAVRFSREQVMELKKKYTHTLNVTLSKEQEDARQQLIKDAVAIFKEGKCSAAASAALATKILQASLGAVYLSDTDRTVKDLHNQHRLDICLELINQTNAKVIVAVPFLSLVDIVSKFLCDKKLSLATITGAVPVKERAEVFNKFQDPKNPLRIIVTQPNCMAHGVTLTEADTLIWYGPVTKFEVYAQTNGRIIRHGQKRQQLIYHLCGSEIEKRYYHNLVSEGDFLEATLKMFESGVF